MVLVNSPDFCFPMVQYKYFKSDDVMDHKLVCVGCKSNCECVYAFCLRLSQMFAAELRGLARHFQVFETPSLMPDSQYDAGPCIALCHECQIFFPSGASVNKYGM